MSKTIYYLGAGASFGKRNSSTIIEGVPIVSEIPKEFSAFRSYIDGVQIPSYETIVFKDYFQTDSSAAENGKQKLLSDIDRLQRGINEHATIDTYARKLYLTKQNNELNTLKNVLCAFFVWTQLEHKVDSRYDAFLANVLDEKSLSLPHDISILSWNYDSQIETAYKAYRENENLPIFEKNLQGGWPLLSDNGRVFKLNGTATYRDGSIVEHLRNMPNKSSTAVQLILFYAGSQGYISPVGFHLNTHLSFAWEFSSNSEIMMRALGETVVDTRQVVVIGYSFPFFNRQTDRAIFQKMPNLQIIYIQDPNSSAVSQSIQSVLPNGSNVRIIPISDCNQFYLPNDL